MHYYEVNVEISKNELKFQCIARHFLKTSEYRRK